MSWPQSFNLTHYRSDSTIWISGGKVRSPSTASLVPVFFWTVFIPPHPQPSWTCREFPGMASSYCLCLLPAPFSTWFDGFYCSFCSFSSSRFLSPTLLVRGGGVRAVHRSHFFQEPAKVIESPPRNSIFLLPQPTSVGVLFFSVLYLDHSWVNLLYFWLHYNLSH